MPRLGPGDGRASGTPDRQRPRTTSWKLWGAVFALMFVATAAYGVFILVPGEQVRAAARWQGRLRDAAVDRANSVAALIRQRAEDAAVIAEFPTTAVLLGKAPADEHDGGDIATHFSRVLRAFAETHGFRSVWVFDASGRPVVGWPEAAAPTPAAMEIANEARRHPGTSAAALVHTGGSSQALVASATDLATVVLASDASVLLGRTYIAQDDQVEHLIVAKDGDRLLQFTLGPSVEGMATVRLHEEALSAAHPEIRATLAGSEDSSVGGEPGAPQTALVAARAVPGTNWVAVARIDPRVVDAGVDAATNSQLLFAATWLLAIGGLGYGVIRSQRAAHDASLLRSEGKFATLLERANDPVLVVRTDGTIEHASERAGEFYGTTVAALVGTSVADLRPPEDRDDARRRLALAATGPGTVFEAVHVRADGTRMPVEVSARGIAFEGELRILASIRDISRRRAAEARVASLTRYLRALVAVNDHIVSDGDPDTLRQSACDVIVERTGVSAAWIGVMSPTTGEFAPCASAGVGRDRIGDVLDVMHGRGHTPLALAGSIGSFGAVDHLGPGAATACVDAQAQLDVRSLVVAPIRSGKATIGVLQLHDSTAGVFDGQILDVVGEIAADLGLALAAIETRRLHEEERARAEAEIRAFAARERERAVEMEAMLDAVPVGVWFADDVAATRIRGNRYAATLLGFQPGTVLSARDLASDAATNPVRTVDGRPLTYDEMPMVVAARECRRIDGLELAFQRADGSRVQVYGNAAPILDAHGVPRGSVGSFLDVTDVRDADARLRVLSRVVEQNTASVVVTDTDGVIEYVNPQFEALTGYSLAEAKGNTPRVLRSGEMPASVYEQLWKTILAGKEWRGELHNRKKDGTLYWEYAVIMPILDEDGRIAHFAAVKEDITLRKEAERALGTAQRELAQSQRLEAIGRLAGGVAHDFNNILGVILGYAELSAARVADGDPLRRNLQEICDAADRAANLTRQLLSFSRRQSVEAGIIDLCACTRDVTKMLRRLIGEDVDLELKLDDDACWVRADPGQVEQLVLNLAVNSRDAMPDGGKLVVSTAPVDVLPPDRTPHGPLHLPQDDLPPGRYAMLSVADTGTGLSPEVRAHLFEPFFTTKEPGKGTGLGLATLWGVVTQCGGHVRYSTEVGRGTTFRIYFPRVEEPVDAPPDSGEPERRRGRGESVLVVEDDASVRSLVQRLVAAAGYRVVAVSGIDEALAAVDAAGAAFDIVLSDVVLPKVGGPEIVRVLRARMPTLRAVFMSGYTERISSQQGELPPGAAFLQKPFTVAKLEQKLREVMDAPF